MPDERSHPLLQQTALAVNPFVDLPKPPTLPPNYTSLPSTLPPSILNTAPTATSSSSSSTKNSELPAYVTSSTGTFAAHPSTIIAQNRGLLEQIQREGEEGRKKVEEWEESIRERELQERRRKAPGWLDREERILEPERKVEKQEMSERSLMDEDGEGSGVQNEEKKVERELNDLGDALDKAFGRSEMG